YLERRLARKASLVGVVASGFADFFVEAGIPAGKIRLLPNWTRMGTSRDTVANVRQRLGWSKDEIVALHAGNMGAKQALENIVDTARLAASIQPRLRFVLMGDGSRRGSLERQGAGLLNLKFLEPQSSEDFPGVLAAADVLLVNERPTVRDMS